MISFSSSKTKTFHVSGDYKGDLVFKKYLDVDGTEGGSVALYGLPGDTLAHFDAGTHTIKITGDAEEEVTFAINCETGPFKETHSIDVNPATGPTGTALYFLFFIVLLVFAWLPFEIEIFKKQADFILGETEDGANWILLTLAGPVCYGTVLHRLPIWFKIAFTVLYVRPIILPIMIYQTEGKPSMLWMWGYISNSTQRFDIFSMLVGAIYYLGVVSGSFFFGSSYQTLTKNGWSFFYIIDYVVIFVCLVVMYWFVWNYVADIGWKSYWGGSFCFIIFPIIMILLYIADFLFGIKNTHTEFKSDDDNDQIP